MSAVGRLDRGGANVMRFVAFIQIDGQLDYCKRFSLAITSTVRSACLTDVSLAITYF